MLRLSGPLQKMQAVLGGAVSATQPDVVVSYRDVGNPDRAEFEPGTKVSTTNGATPVDICDAPGSATVREIDFISIRNNDSASVTVTVRLNNDGTSYKLIRVTLATLEHLYYSHVAGWYVIGTRGQLKNGYEEGPTWTPAVTFATPGDLSVAYSGFRNGTRTKYGRFIWADFNILTSTFTHTTASGSLLVTGLLDAAANESNVIFAGAVLWSGITKAGYTQVMPYVLANESQIRFTVSGSGVGVADLVAADMPTGGTVTLRGFVLYRT